MSQKIFKFEFTFDSGLEGTEWGEYISLLKLEDAKKQFVEIVQDHMVQIGVQLEDLKLVEVIERDIVGNEGDKELLKKYYYCVPDFYLEANSD